MESPPRKKVGPALGGGGARGMAHLGVLKALETMIRWSGGGLVTADCLISPAIDDLSYVRFARWAKRIALGMAGAESKLPEIRAALGL